MDFSAACSAVGCGFSIRIGVANQIIPQIPAMATANMMPSLIPLRFFAGFAVALTAGGFCSAPQYGHTSLAELIGCWHFRQTYISAASCSRLGDFSFQEIAYGCSACPEMISPSVTDAPPAGVLKNTIQKLLLVSCVTPGSDAGALSAGTKLHTEGCPARDAFRLITYISVSARFAVAVSSAAGPRSR